MSIRQLLARVALNPTPGTIATIEKRLRRGMWNALLTGVIMGVIIGAMLWKY